MRKRMYRLLLVDDEPWALTGLKEIIPWDAYGFEIAALCKNAEEALELCRKTVIHAVFTDIRMPGMNGVKLIGKIKELKSDAECVIVSAYSDFEAAREAIEHRASGYLLKPLEEAEVRKTAERIRSLLDERRSEDLILISPGRDSFGKASERIGQILPLPWHCAVLFSDEGLFSSFHDPPPFVPLTIQGAAVHAAIVSSAERNTVIAKPDGTQGEFFQGRWHEGSGELELMLMEASAAGCGNFVYTENQAVSAIQFFIGKNYKENFSLAELASRFSISKSYIGELFKKYAGETIVRFTGMVRLKNACRLLEHLEKPVKEIADETGFNDISYFCRSFRRRFGITPFRFRERRLDEGRSRPDFSLPEFSAEARIGSQTCFFP
ncbi:MAG: response regulator [Treponema sp.]|jgi:two-component system response regulator YesN|nr:response regulator [Treponema sp.]